MRWVLVLAGVILPALSALADPRMGPSPVGRWLTQDRDGVIEITACAEGMCGRIIGMDSVVEKDGRPVVDVTGVPQCGLTILRAAADEAGHWVGRITDPQTGKAWRCRFWVDDSGRLNLRGYVLVPVLGQTQVWTPFTGTTTAECRF